MPDQPRRVLARPQEGETKDEFKLRFLTALIGEEEARATIKAQQEREAQEATADEAPAATADEA
jgi:hypothetical protein